MMLLPFLLQFLLSTVATQTSLFEGSAKGSLPYYRHVPTTSFRCENQQWAGYYSDPEADCQVFHICIRRHEKLEQFSFLCPNETVFHQQLLVCVWWDGFECTSAPSLYYINEHIFEVGGGDLEAHVARSQSKALVPESRSTEPESHGIQSIENDTPSLGKSLFSTLGPSTENINLDIENKDFKSKQAGHIEPKEQTPLRTNTNALRSPYGTTKPKKEKPGKLSSSIEDRSKSKFRSQLDDRRQLLNDAPESIIYPPSLSQKAVQAPQYIEKKQKYQVTSTGSNENFSSTLTTKSNLESLPFSKKFKTLVQNDNRSRIIEKTTAKSKLVSPTLPPTVSIQSRPENIKNEKATKAEINLPVAQYQKTIVQPKSPKFENVFDKSTKQSSPKQLSKTTSVSKIIYPTKIVELSNKSTLLKPSTPKKTLEHSVPTKIVTQSEIISSTPRTTPKEIIKVTLPPSIFSQKSTITSNNRELTPLPPKTSPFPPPEKSIALHSPRKQNIASIPSRKQSTVSFPPPTQNIPFFSRKQNIASNPPRNQNIASLSPLAKNTEKLFEPVSPLQLTTSIPIQETTKKPKNIRTTSRPKSIVSFQVRNLPGRLTEYDILHEFLKNVTILRSEALLKSNVNERRRNPRQNIKTSESEIHKVEVKASKKSPSKFTSSRGIEREISIKKQNRVNKKTNKRVSYNSTDNRNIIRFPTAKANTAKYLPDKNQSKLSISTESNKFLNIPGVELPLAVPSPSFKNSSTLNENFPLTNFKPFIATHFESSITSSEESESPLIAANGANAENTRKSQKKAYLKLTSVPRSSSIATQPTKIQKLATEKHFGILDSSRSNSDEKEYTYVKPTKKSLYGGSSTQKYGSLK